MGEHHPKFEHNILTRSEGLLFCFPLRVTFIIGCDQNYGEIRLPSYAV